jgi:hypothetical protein
VKKLSDAQLCAIASAVLFVLSAWPAFLVRLPPLQDLPAHLATLTVLRHPDAYPDFVATGFFKTNSALFAALSLFSNLYWGGKVCVLAVLLVTALVIPRLVLDLGGRARVISGALAAIPLVHGWFVAMGMLDYALAAVLGLEWIRSCAMERKDPKRLRLVWLAVLGALVWWTHAFVVLVLGLLLAVDAVRRKSIDKKAVATIAPAVVLSAISFFTEVGRARPTLGHGVVYRPLWETFYDLWAQHGWAFTRLEAGSLVSFAFLAFCLIRWRKEPAELLSPLAAAVLFVLHFVLPVEAHDWFAVNVRLLPFLYACALLRVPEKLPGWATGLLAAAGLSVSVGLGVDYVRLDRDYREIASGIDVVPNRAAMYPLMFDTKGSSENTWALVNGWAFYVIEKQTSAPLLFAHSPSFPLKYKNEPPAARNQLAIAGFAQQSHDAAEWRSFLADIEPAHDTLLVWGTPPAEFAPAEHVEIFRNGRLRILRRP